MEKKEETVLGMDIYRLERNGARENAGANPEDVSIHHKGSLVLCPN
jgi:hypothetical protein